MLNRRKKEDESRELPHGSANPLAGNVQEHAVVLHEDPHPVCYVSVWNCTTHSPPFTLPLSRAESDVLVSLCPSQDVQASERVREAVELKMRWQCQ